MSKRPRKGRLGFGQERVQRPISSVIKLDAPLRLDADLVQQQRVKRNRFILQIDQVAEKHGLTIQDIMLFAQNIAFLQHRLMLLGGLGFFRLQLFKPCLVAGILYLSVQCHK